MTNIEFINNAFTEDGLRLPMIHFNNNEKDIIILLRYVEIYYLKIILVFFMNIIEDIQ